MSELIVSLKLKGTSTTFGKMFRVVWESFIPSAASISRFRPDDYPEDSICYTRCG